MVTTWLLNSVDRTAPKSVWDELTMPKCTCDPACHYEPCGTMWIVVYRTDFICVVVRSGDLDVTRLRGSLKDLLIGKSFFNFRKSLFLEIEDLGGWSGKLHRRFCQRIKKPLGVVSEIPGTPIVGPKSCTALIALVYGKTVFLGMESRISFCHGSLIVVVDDDYDKSVQLEETVFLAILGDVVLMDRVKDAFSYTEGEWGKDMEEIARNVVFRLNRLFRMEENFPARDMFGCLLGGIWRNTTGIFCISSDGEFFTSKKGLFYLLDGSGGTHMEDYVLRNPLMRAKDATGFVDNILNTLKAAVKADEECGGRIRLLHFHGDQKLHRTTRKTNVTRESTIWRPLPGGDYRRESHVVKG